MVSLLEYSLQELREIIENFGEASFRAKQLIENLYQGKGFFDMTNIPSGFKKSLAESYLDIPVCIEKKFVSKDGTIKYLFKLFDGELIEGVLMSYAHGRTLCISTQVGCRMGCTFCASGTDGLKRNLTAAEMLGQVIVAGAEVMGQISLTADKISGEQKSNDKKQTKATLDKQKSRAITNVVLMGSGEPFDNFENVFKFLTLLTSPDTLNFSERNISISTVGLIDKIKVLADFERGYNLTISLHAPTDYLRARLMPVTKSQKLSDLIDSAKYYFKKTGRRFIFEYALINGINDTKENALELVKLVKGLPCHVNIIRLNPVDKKQLIPSSIAKQKAFLEILTSNNISATMRRTLGADIEGACGQLKARFLQEE